MVNELIIHLGDPKTGTTSIQATLAHRQFKAEGADLVYPARFNHIPFAKAVGGSSPDDAVKLARKLASTFKASDATYGVISAEHFGFVDPARLAALFDGPFKPWRDRVRLISYIRPHADRFLAAFTERSKMGWLDGTMETFAARAKKSKLLFYAPRVANWRASFGDRYTVRPFVRDCLEDGDVVRDFFSFVFGDAPVAFTGATQQNESLSLEDLVLLRYIHGAIKSKDPDLSKCVDAFGWNFAPILAAQPAAQSTKIRLHDRIARRLQKTYREDAATLDAMAFEGTPMSDRLARASEGALAEPLPLNPEDHHTPEVLRLAAAQAELLSRVMAADPAHFRWAVREEDIRTPLKAFYLSKAYSGFRIPKSGTTPGRASALRKRLFSKTDG